MVTAELTWQQAAGVSAALLGSAAVAARAGRSLDRPRLVGAAVVAREAGLLFGLFALWQLAGSVSLLSAQGALRRAAWIWHAERVLGLPSEAAVQRLFLPHPLLVQAFNWYYAILHFPVLIGCLIWLFCWHRDRYGQFRTTLVLFTAAALLVQLIPVAPPRLLPGAGMTDTALAYGQSVYGAHSLIEADQLSAMPSVHAGWALLVALAVVTIARSRWRWLALGYPALTTLVVVVTANHFWLDCIAAWALLALALAVQRAGRAARPALASAVARARRRSVPASQPVRPEVGQRGQPPARMVTSKSLRSTSGTCPTPSSLASPRAWA